MHDSAPAHVNHTVNRALLAVSFLSVCLIASADTNLDRLLKTIEYRYNNAKTLQVHFTESYTVQGQPRRTESGELTLRKPGRMRWQYSTPAGKLFVSDGKEVYLYSPDTNQVQKMKLKQSEDIRAPLAFLLGKLDFNKDFRNFQMKPDGGNWSVTADAQTQNLPYQKIEMLVNVKGEIQRLVITGQDRSVLTFQFANETVNPPVNDAIFKFKMPAGAVMAQEIKE